MRLTPVILLVVAGAAGIAAADGCTSHPDVHLRGAPSAHAGLLRSLNFLQ